MKIFSGKITNDKLFEDALSLRHEVFTLEQKIPAQIDRDEADKIATHYVGYIDERPVAVARLIPDDSEIKIGRLAVAKDCRRQGLGGQLLAQIIADMRDQPLPLTLESQADAVHFYRSYGFEICGEPYTNQTGIQHLSLIYSQKK